MPSGILKICRFNKLLVNHFKIEDLTGNNKKICHWSYLMISNFRQGAAVMHVSEQVAAL